MTRENIPDLLAWFRLLSSPVILFLIIADGVFSQSKLIISKERLKAKYNNSMALRGKLNKYDDNNISIFM